jgi:hypothetical protein
MKIKQVSADSSDETGGVYAVTEGGKLLFGYWSLGRMYWQEVTPEKDDVQGWKENDD